MCERNNAKQDIDWKQLFFFFYFIFHFFPLKTRKKNSNRNKNKTEIDSVWDVSVVIISSASNTHIYLGIINNYYVFRCAQIKLVNRDRSIIGLGTITNGTNRHETNLNSMIFMQKHKEYTKRMRKIVAFQHFNWRMKEKNCSTEIKEESQWFENSKPNRRKS